MIGKIITIIVVSVTLAVTVTVYACIKINKKP